MKKTILLLVFLWIGAPFLKGQCNSNITLSTQSQVDNFASNYGCSVLDASLTIDGESIINLDGLAGLVEIDGGLFINYAESLQNINGLSGLTTLGSLLYIVGNEALENLDGLSNLTTVQSNIQIRNNAVLQNIDGLSNLNIPILGDLEIENNPVLQNIDGIGYIGILEGSLRISWLPLIQNINSLSSLTAIDGYVAIYSNPNLENITGLSNVISQEDGLIMNSLSLNDNDALISLEGLEGIEIVGELSIGGNEVLNNVDGLSNLTSSGFLLDISANPSLVSIEGLSQLGYCGKGCYVYSNENLMMCCAALCWSGPKIINSNATGCNSVGEINTVCDGECMPVEEMTTGIKLFLEGAYNNDETMRTLLTNQIPLNQPYSISPYNYNGMESLDSIPHNMVDWLLVELREGTPSEIEKSTVVVETKAAILLETGEVVGTDGLGLIMETIAAGEEYHLCIRHRNHLDILSANEITNFDPLSYDFSSASDQAFGSVQQAMMSDGKAALFVGDYTQDGVIQISDWNAWVNNPAQVGVYAPTDGTLDGIIQNTDSDAWLPNKAKIGSVEVSF